MSYRKIEVDGVVYQFTIGKTHVKVRWLGSWPKKDIGEITVRTYGCGCGCYPDEDIVYTAQEFVEFASQREFEPEYSIRVRPRHIVSKIRETV